MRSDPIMTMADAARHADLPNKSALLRQAATRLVRESREVRGRAKALTVKMWCMAGQRTIRGGASPADRH
jgi:hypothetical protein